MITKKMVLKKRSKTKVHNLYQDRDKMKVKRKKNKEEAKMTCSEKKLSIREIKLEL
jgi:hypothetical protein